MENQAQSNPYSDSDSLLKIDTKVAGLIVTVEDAIIEIQKRRANTKLMEAVSDYLNRDFPSHFLQETPILYLARHVATPNYETLDFIKQCQKFDFPIVIGEDVQDKFVSHNSLKRALGKMSILKGHTKTEEEVIECFTIINFDEAQGKSFAEIQTKFGKKLVDFHHDLFNEVYPSTVHIIDESDWISRHKRGNILEHYQQYLSLFIAHGVMFERYEPEDIGFVETILIPAFNHVTEKFGCKPLICNIETGPNDLMKNWNSYPSVFYPILKELFK